MISEGGWKTWSARVVFRFQSAIRMQPQSSFFTARNPIALFLDALQPVRAGHAAGRSTPLPPPGPCCQLSRSARLERDLRCLGCRVRGSALFLAGTADCAGVRYRLCSGSFPERRQSFRFSPDLQLFRRSRPVPASRFILGRHRGASVARHLYWCRRRSDLPFSLGALRIRGSSHHQRHPLLRAGAAQGRSRGESSGKSVSPLCSGNERLPGRKVLRSKPAGELTLVRHAIAGSASGHRNNRHSLCGRFHSRSSRHYPERLYCIYIERIRDSGAALDVFRGVPPDEGFSLFAFWTGGCARAGGPEDADVAIFSGFHVGYVERGGGCDLDRNRDLGGFPRRSSEASKCKLRLKQSPRRPQETKTTLSPRITECLRNFLSS